MAGETQIKQGHGNGKSVLRYMLLPEFLPRIRDLGGSGFGYLAFLIARVYNAVRILPSTHPYTQPANIGTFTVLNVVAAAAAHVKMDRQHLDQVVIFFAVLAGIVILALQFVLLAITLISGTAFAAGTFDGIFATAQPKDDIAFMLLDHVFGIPQFFGSKVMDAGQTPMHIALQALFRFYNMAILIVAVLIFLYFVFVVVAETAQTGTPFGQRFNSVYAPLRLVFAIGLLVPLNYGFNGSQYITLMAARLGSGMATNGWTIYNNTLKDADKTPLGTSNAELIASTKAPETANLAAFATVVHTCISAYKYAYNKEIKGYMVYDNKAQDFSGVDFVTARKLTDNGDIHVVFGEYDRSLHMQYSGNVRPYCGSIVIPMSTRNPDIFVQPSSSGPSGRGRGPRRGGSGTKVGPELVQDMYFIYAQSILYKAASRGEMSEQAKQLEALGERYADYRVNYKTCTGFGKLKDEGDCQIVYDPPDTIRTDIVSALNPIVETGVKRAIKSARDNSDFSITDEILKRGWGGAGMWYNKVAEAGGAMVAAIKSFPAQKSYPEIMEVVRKERQQKSPGSDSCEMFDLDQASGEKLKNGGEKDLVLAQAMADAYRYWCKDPSAEKGLSGNAIWDAIDVVFGTNGLFDLRENRNDGVHPLAQMTATGKLLVESSIRNVMAGIGSSIAGGMIGALNQNIGASFQALSGFFVSIALIGLVAGFILFYILPFLPFMYFFFAVGKWVKTIFEAMVGAPLWALAHLRIDGDGFPGRGASNGYFLIFEIFIRPILTVFGLIGGLAIFTAMTVILNELFNIVVFNLTKTSLDGGTGTGGTISTGFEEMRRNVVDQFFYTIVYAVIMYMMAISSFKMIDLVPNSILRWIGAGVSSFSDNTQDATEGLVQYAAIGGYTVGNRLIGATQKLGTAGGQVLGAGLAMGLQKPDQKGGQ